MLSRMPAFSCCSSLFSRFLPGMAEPPRHRALARDVNIRAGQSVPFLPCFGQQKSRKPFLVSCRCAPPVAAGSLLFNEGPSGKLRATPEKVNNLLQTPDTGDIGSSSFRFGRARAFSFECPPTLPLLEPGASPQTPFWVYGRLHTISWDCSRWIALSSA